MSEELDELRIVAAYLETEGWGFIRRALEKELRLATEALIDADSERRRGRIHALRDVLEIPEQVQARIRTLEEEEEA